MLTRKEYTIIEPTTDREPACSNATPAIVVEGPGKRGEIVQVCTDPKCEVHGKPDYTAQEEAAAQGREQERQRLQQQREKNREINRGMLDTVLQHLPKALARADYEMLAFAAIERFNYEDWEAVIEHYKIDTEEQREPDAPAFELRNRAQKATEPELIRMLIEFTLLRSGYSDEILEASDPLANAALRYNVSLASKAAKPKPAKCTPKGKRKVKKAPKSKPSQQPKTTC